MPYSTFAIAFIQHCWRRVRAGHELPLFSIVPEFHVRHEPEQSRAAFLLYPMGAREPAEWDQVIDSIDAELHRFATDGDITGSGPWERPIR